MAAKTKKLKEQATQLGMGTIVAALKTLEQGVSKRKYKRLLATAVAQLLTLHPDLGPRQARRRARKVTGAKPAKNALVRPSRGIREGLETAAVAAAGGAALKVAGKLGEKVTAKVKDVMAGEKGSEQSTRPA